jgi:hypothetical protein
MIYGTGDGFRGETCTARAPSSVTLVLHVYFPAIASFQERVKTVTVAKINAMRVNGLMTAPPRMTFW